MLAVVSDLRAALAGRQAEVAHLKAIALADGAFAVANLVSSATRPELSLPSGVRVGEMELIVNARVALDPAVLEQEVRAAVATACARHGAAATFGATQSFRPGRPTPTHRYATAIA